MDADRLATFALKAVREAKLRTSWLEPDTAYEDGVRRYTRAICGDAELRAEIGRFVADQAPAARDACLGQLLLKLTCPGVPDVYQGTELWDLSLVDPDNRRPVDYELRRRALAGLPTTDVDGALKLGLLRAGLGLRRARPAAFGPGSCYTPLDTDGDGSVIAFGRGQADDPLAVVVMVPRFPARPGAPAPVRLDLGEGRWRGLPGDAELSGPSLRLEPRPTLLERVA